MGSQLIEPSSEAAIWARLMQGLGDDLSAETAEYLLSIRFSEGDQTRMTQLAESSEAGSLTAKEQAEFDSYLHVGNLLAIMQSRARMALRRRQA